MVMQINGMVNIADLNRMMDDAEYTLDVNNITFDILLNSLCKFFEQSKDDVIQKNATGRQSRKRELVQTRQMFMYYSHKFTRFSSGTIGLYLNGLDHATTLHGIKTIGNLIETNREFRNMTMKFERKFGLSSYIN